MSDVLAIAAHSMASDLARMSVISQNLANATTPGYKKELPVSRPFVEYLQAAGEAGLFRYQATLPAATSVIDARPGSVRHTGAPLDLALDGDGWFELSTAQGPLYTRQGSFQLDARGRLVTTGGIPLAGDITLTTNQPRIDSLGRIYEDDRIVGQLRIVAFERPEQMQKLGDGLFAAPTSDAGHPFEARVRQGHLENSNVVTATEMVRIIETMRHFEANQKLIQGWDGMLDRAIRTLGEF